LAKPNRVGDAHNKMRENIALMYFTMLPKRPKFLPQNAKMALENPHAAAEKIRGRILCRIPPKNGRKGAELLEVCFTLKIFDNLNN
jgi:hypothetical protein